jgi:antitoxin YefM
MSADDLESLNETFAALQIPGFVDELRQADVDFAAGNTVSGEEIRKRYGLT